MKKTVILASVFLVQSVFLVFGAYAGNGVLKAGIGKVDITPTESLSLSGYDTSCRSELSQGVYGKIYNRALVFDDGEERLVFIVADVVMLYPEDSRALRSYTAEKTDIPFENILLSTSHNHAAPHYGPQNEKTQWYDGFKDNIVSTVKKAISDLEPVKIGGGVGTSHIAMNRRKKMEDTLSDITFDENNSSQSHGQYKTDNPAKIREMAGVYRLGANPDGPIDSDVGVMRIDKLSGKPKALFVNYACHGTSLGCRNTVISPEWNGHMLEYVEKNIPGVTGIFANGAAGDINPRFVGGLDGYEDSLKKTADLGFEIGKEVVRVYNTIATAEPINHEIQTAHRDITCPRKYRSVMQDFKNTTLDVPTTAVRIDDFTWVTFPGELFHEIGMTVKSSTHTRNAYLVGYCNGYFGYLVQQEAYSQGGYEPTVSPYAPVAEKIYVKEMKKMVTELY